MVNVLILDDNRNTLEIYQRWISRQAREREIDVTVRAVRTAREAQQYINWAEIAYIDAHLEHETSDTQTGYQVIDDIKAQNPTAVTVLVSGIGIGDIPNDCPVDHFVSRELATEENLIRFIQDYLTSQEEARNPSRTPLQTYIRKTYDSSYGSGFELERNHPQNDLTDEFVESLEEEFGKGNIQIGDAFDVDGNLIPYDKGLRGVYVRRQKTEENPT